MFHVIQTKLTAFKGFVARILRLLRKTYLLSISNPAVVPLKIKRKLFNFLTHRIDTSFLYRGRVRISGQFYPMSHLLASDAQVELPNELPTIVIIIPIYRNVEITKRCIDSVLRSKLPISTKILLLNDCSPDPEMPAVLDSYKKDGRVEVVHNEENLGFVRNVNNGMTLAGDSDVVLLNSDTVVAGDWLLRMYAHSQSGQNVSSVTATSNNATICSFPGMDGYSNWPLGLSTAKAQEILSAHNNGRSVEIPTAVGFCMYITRRSIRALGLFDAEAFGKGYGEENDFSMRGIKKGWRHLQALDVAVFHEGEVSFGAASHPGKARATEIIRKRYPDYDLAIGEFLRKDPARAKRLGALLSALPQAGKKVELICTHVHGGGVERAVAEYIKSRQDKVNFMVLQRSHQTGYYKFSSAIDGLDFSFEFSSKFAAEVFRQTLQTAAVSRLHIHHVMDFDSRILTLVRDSNIPFDFWIHDYWTICPQITLTTAKGRYCGEPDESSCNKCFAARRERNLAPLVDGLARDIVSWREQYRWLFDRAQSISAPSRDTAERMSHYYPKANIVAQYLEDHESLKREPIQLRHFDGDKRLKVAVIGGIGIHKGLYRLSDLQGEIKRESAPIELKVFGTTDSAINMDHPVNCSGAYKDSQLPEMLAKAGVQVIWFPEGAPETYSYTLSHAMKNGYPIVAPDLGAFPERIKDRPWTFLTKPGIKSQDVLAQLMNVREMMLDELKKQSS